eukprot:4581773-Pyramimonas_sp.AAC.1
MPAPKQLKSADPVGVWKRLLRLFPPRRRRRRRRRRSFPFPHSVVASTSLPGPPTEACRSKAKLSNV